MDACPLLTTAKLGDNALGSVRPSVCGYVCVWVCPSDLSGVCLCVCDQSAYADNRADAVDRLLIIGVIS